MKIVKIVNQKASKYLMRKNSLITFVIVFFFSFSVCHSQIIVSGVITDVDRKPVANAHVFVKLPGSPAIIAYTYAEDDGRYRIKVAVKEDFVLTSSSLGFKSYTDTIAYSSVQQENLHIDISLAEETTTLNEVIIHPDSPIRVKKDTIVFKTSQFTDGTEQTVEDLLKKIPGLQINSEGTIKVGNQEIEKLMVEGDDLFEKGYKILSKNMPAYPVKEVELLNNFSNNKLLKGIEESDKVALNLKLDEKSKRIWFGDIEAGLGNDEFYQLKGNLMNFGNKNKYYFLTNLNTIGYDATGDINHLIHPSINGDNPGSIGDDQNAFSLIRMSPGLFSFKQNRTHFNNAKLVSLNAVFNPTDKLKIKPLVFLNWDKVGFFRNTYEQINVAGASFTNQEDYSLQNRKRIGFGKIDFTYDVSKTTTIEAVTRYNDGDFSDGSALIFNGKNTVENLQSQNTLFDQKISYTNKLTERKALLVTGRFTTEETPQNYMVNRFFYQGLFPDDTTADNVRQYSTNKMEFAGINTHLLDRNKNGNLLELQLGNEYRRDKLNSVFSLYQDDIELIQSDGFQNKTTYRVNDLYFKSKYRLKINDFGITGRLDLHQLSHVLHNKELSDKQQLFFVNPGISFDWKPNDKNKLISSYSFNTKNARITDVYSDFVLTGFRSFQKGTGAFNQLNSSNFTLNYQLGNWTDRFFVNTFIVYNKNYDFFSTHTQIAQDYTQAEKILIKNREFINISTSIDYFVRFISSNIKVNTGYSKSGFKNIINHSELRHVGFFNYDYGLELRSGLSGIFNYHIGTKWTRIAVKTDRKNTSTDNVSFLDLSFVFSKKLDVQIESERYYFGNLKTDHTYYFLDFDARYKLNDKLLLSLTGKNLMNTGKFKNYRISDIGATTTEYRLLPRIVMLKAAYRF